jgi:hypothetical protein
MDGVREVAEEFVAVASRSPLLDIELRRVAIFKQAIRRFDLPPLRVKNSDSRSPEFIHKHGDQCIEQSSR